MDSAILHTEALRLPPGERALLADALLVSLDQETTHEVESAWGRVAEARLAEYRQGMTESVDGPSLLAELRRRYAP